MAISKVLVVDDSPADLKNISNIVSEAGFSVVSATNGKDAVQMAKAEKPNIIFLDIIMPAMDGFATCRATVGAPSERPMPPGKSR